MKINYILSLFTCLILFVSSCTEDNTQPANNNNGGNNNGGFTIPETTIWKINGTSFSPSATAVSVNLKACSMGVNKPFSDLGFGYCQLRVFFNGTMTSNEPDIRAAVPEGGHIVYDITTLGSNRNDSIRVELDVEDQNSSSAGNYFYRAKSGKVYVSKKNGKMRFSSMGTLEMEGVKYPNMQSYSFNCNLEFSQVEP